MNEQAKCQLCGEPMPTGEEMFSYHGYSGPCPKPPLQKPPFSQALVDLMNEGDWQAATKLCIAEIDRLNRVERLTAAPHALTAREVEARSIIEAIETALNGESVSDFMASFQLVRQVEDLVRERYLCRCGERAAAPHAPTEPDGPKVRPVVRAGRRISDDMVHLDLHGTAMQVWLTRDEALRLAGDIEDLLSVGGLGQQAPAQPRCPTCGLENRRYAGLTAAHRIEELEGLLRKACEERDAALRAGGAQ